MKKHFYSHIIEMTPLHMSLDGLELDPQEKQELITLIESSVHHTILDTVLSELSDEHKKVFLSLVIRNEHDQVWQLLATNIPQAEDKIRTAAKVLLEKMHDDIKVARKKK